MTGSAAWGLLCSEACFCGHDLAGSGKPHARALRAAAGDTQSAYAHIMGPHCLRTAFVYWCRIRGVPGGRTRVPTGAVPERVTRGSDRKRRPLRRLETTATVSARAARGVPRTALKECHMFNSMHTSPSLHGVMDALEAAR